MRQASRLWLAVGTVLVMCSVATPGLAQRIANYSMTPLGPIDPQNPSSPVLGLARCCLQACNNTFQCWEMQAYINGTPDPGARCFAQQEAINRSCLANNPAPSGPPTPRNAIPAPQQPRGTLQGNVVLACVVPDGAGGSRRCEAPPNAPMAPGTPCRCGASWPGQTRWVPR